jgi:predicted membrane channel-forming protein YqfA (hemolysin III family)
VTPCDQERISLTRRSQGVTKPREEIVNGLIYLIGLIVVILFILSFLGLR